MITQQVFHRKYDFIEPTSYGAVGGHTLELLEIFTERIDKFINDIEGRFLSIYYDKEFTQAIVVYDKTGD